MQRGKPLELFLMRRPKTADVVVLAPQITILNEYQEFLILHGEGLRYDYDSKQGYLPLSIANTSPRSAK
jgi:hypothetical protein